MSHQSHTKDEKFILCLYEAARQRGEIATPFNKYEIGKKASLHPKAVDAIGKLLVRANFIKKSDGDDIYMTPYGERLALQLLGE